MSLTLPAMADAAKGKEVFEERCEICHNADSDEKKMGPGLKGLYKKEKMANGKAPTDANVTQIIQEGSPEKGMPASDLEKDELANVLAYLKTL